MVSAGERWNELVIVVQSYGCGIGVAEKKQIRSRATVCTLRESRSPHTEILEGCWSALRSGSL